MSSLFKSLVVPDGITVNSVNELLSNLGASGGLMLGEANENLLKSNKELQSDEKRLHLLQQMIHSLKNEHQLN